ncbi:mitochondrial intermediate peptidase, mitochondrial isoform X2 [Dioscorea cayenensis subsp. rotundata]|uniref:Mitochondrial intermediate peptidase, mitochondrial isoform X2 n=1 Tax=Dioscorea cayennensis subsp. rotundata TaxID=55577 RepID=A0AB40B899_DIOCR|nr:mitochondrial intermediate peptidase, mitochondrial isoform X2 [Dioscorea cayenensis subsp. rotundata]
MNLMLRRAASAFPTSSSRRLFSGSCFDSTAPAAAASPDSSPGGLYGFPVLRTAKGFRRFVDDAIERSGELVSYVSLLPPSGEIIRALDEISDTVCAVIDSAELCRNTHPDREFVEEANKASMRIIEHLHFLNTNQSLYDAVKRAEDIPLLTDEAQRAAHALRTDFEKGGIHLPADKLERVNKLNVEIAHLGREFNENIMIDPGSLDIFPASRIPKHMHHCFKPIYQPIHKMTKGELKVEDIKKEKGFRVRTDPSMLSSLLQFVSDAEVRKQSYITGNSAPHANLGVLNKLISARHELAQVIASYFPLSQCLEGLKIMVNSLFGATFHKVAFAAGESWHPDVIKLSLHHPQEGDLGFLYLDLYSRKGKYPGCAHFAIRGGRQISEKEYQLPIVALVCNFSTGTGSMAPRINHCDLETLFHEFGHALHSLLSRTDYQHFSGTRVLLDFAETPSNLFEYYARDYRVLKTFARHYVTGDAIPEKLVTVMNGARNMFAATELQRQIFYSMIDLTLFGEEAAASRDTVSVVSDLKRQYTSWKHADGTHWHTRFSHLINYGAGYYSYLYARCFASTIWQQVCCEDPLSPTVGAAIRSKLLQHGGAKDPANLLRDFAGDNILECCDGGVAPNITSLREELGL